MSKKPSKKNESSGVDKQLLAKIVEATQSGNHFMVTREEATPFMNHAPALIEVNMGIVEGDKAAARATAEGIAMVQVKHQESTAVTSGAAVVSSFQLLKGVELPASRRGQGLRGSRTKYPFDQMGIGDSFFVPVSEDIPEPIKTLSSVVSSANMRYAEETGETKTVTRSKRGPDRKTVFENGVKVKETVDIPVHKFTRKYEIRGVKSGVSYGTWTAPSDGVLIARSK
jgi:hypothetical protein